MYNGSIEVVSLTFNTIGTDKSSWFSQNNLLQSPWTDIKTATNLHAFSNEGDARMFEISYEYEGCPGDNGWFLITEQHRLGKVTATGKSNILKPAFYTENRTI